MSKIKCENLRSAPAPQEPRKRKKWVLPVVIVVVLILLASCAAGGGNGKQPSGTASGGSSSQAADPTSETEKAPAAVTISEQELYNRDGIVVTAKKLQDGFLGPEISVTVENNSAQNIVVSTRSLSVNDFMLSASGLYSNVAAGKKDNTEISLMSSELRESGISTIGEVAFYLNIANADTFHTIDTTELITIQTTASGTFTQETDDSGDEVYSGNNLRVVSKGLKKDSVWDGTVVFYLENNSGKALTVYAENVSVNGYMVDVGMYSELRPNTRMVDGMYLLNTELDSIDDIHDIEFNLRVVDSDTFQSIAASDVIRLEFTS